MKATEKKNRPTPKQVRPGKPGRSGNPARRIDADATLSEPVVAPQDSASTGTLVFRSVLILALASLYTFAIMYLPWSVHSEFLVAMLAVPALATMVFVPEARTRGIYRWPVAWTLGFTSIFPIPMLILAQTWVLVRFWVIEYTPRAPRISKRAK